MTSQEQLKIKQQWRVIRQSVELYISKQSFQGSHCLKFRDVTRKLGIKSLSTFHDASQKNLTAWIPSQTIQIPTQIELLLKLKVFHKTMNNSSWIFDKFEHFKEVRNLQSPILATQSSVELYDDINFLSSRKFRAIISNFNEREGSRTRRINRKYGHVF